MTKMKKTKVDDMLIEMISPKVREIEEKFSHGQALTQDDINTLLLKSQYNHINHLDAKLDETVESVKNLEHQFKTLEQKFDVSVKQMRSDYEKLEQKLTNDYEKLEQRFIGLEQRFGATVKELKSDYQKLEQKLTGDYQKLEQKLTGDYQKLEQAIETTIQKALNKNMMMLIIVIGAFMTLSKLIDKF